MGISLLNFLIFQKNIRVYTITKDQIGDCPEKIKTVKEFIRREYPLRENEYLMIATDLVSKDIANTKEKELKKLLDKNVSIRIVVQPTGNEVISLSAILSDWLSDLGEYLVSTIKILLPKIVLPEEIKKKLEEEIKSVWKLLSAA